MFNMWKSLVSLSSRLSILYTCVCLIGNDLINKIAEAKMYTLQIVLTTIAGVRIRAEYSEFKMGDEASKYRLESLGTFTGDCKNTQIDRL